MTGARRPPESLCESPSAHLTGSSPSVRTLLNIVWLVLSGFWLFLGYALAAVIMFVLIVTIPWGIAAWRIGVYSLWPFGKDVIDRPTAGIGSAIGNVVWVVLAGWWLALGHIASAIALAITIIGIPFAWANLKMVPVALLPLGKQIVEQR
ncbi:uncharacterized membrane protein YccF (DUF307 family) [Yonghaparkia alkaliphila]|uniref:Uncharacterized membrane protein YccF (DUF307 family) n=1 Tax=Microcella alkalica TaxID=355930 RepID=A0A839E8C8_9MICO|nr:YccF domain-containing protein [Microcella alkalica]MBA8847443.1 uncharacterized membrane protein YccF (DUF307 family) [Microcella alkalica]